MSTTTETRAAWMVDRLVPFVHVADVEASLAFYALLGFETRHVMRDGAGRAFWALAQSGGKDTGEGAEIMFARADGPVDPAQQAVLFYMYSSDVAGLRAGLLAGGLHDGGVYRGLPGPNRGRRVVFEVATQHYMPGGEVRVADPDGYCVLVGQLA
jgi:hypothetical protein